ncbi:unnamed protein product [Peniophora sp. CBMAI 1063]|nr:unnamed protein product [Peniophora sp. CBMAI 1063]
MSLARLQSTGEEKEELEAQVDWDLTKSLPAELLRDIFYILAESDPARLMETQKAASEALVYGSPLHNVGLSSSGRLRGWFVVAHVCARTTVSLEHR